MTALYRYYTAKRELLYVGIADDWTARNIDHSKRSPWWPDVASLTLEHFPERSEAERAERIAIECENPLHNVQLNSAPKPAVKSVRRKRLSIDLSPYPDVEEFINASLADRPGVTTTYVIMDIVRRHMRSLLF